MNSKPLGLNVALTDMSNDLMDRVIKQVAEARNQAYHHYYPVYGHEPYYRIEQDVTFKTENDMVVLSTTFSPTILPIEEDR